MIPWNNRPIEVASLLNPAFCGRILLAAVENYRAEKHGGLPYPLAFLILPIILHSATRQQISARQRIPMHAWLQQHPELKIGFAERARSFVPVTNEAIAFMLQIGGIRIDEHGVIDVIQAGILKNHASHTVGANDTDVADCVAKAAIVGRWLARGGTPATIYASWGVRP